MLNLLFIRLKKLQGKKTKISCDKCLHTSVVVIVEGRLFFSSLVLFFYVKNLILAINGGQPVVVMCCCEGGTVCFPFFRLMGIECLEHMLRVFKLSLMW